MKSALGVICAILHTGNIDFQEKEASHKGEACMITNMDLVNIGKTLSSSPELRDVKTLQIASCIVQ